MMMKKMLVLMLVLGVSSMASAGTIDLVISSWGPDPGQNPPVTDPIDPVSEITIGPSEWVNLDIIYTGAVEDPPVIQLSVYVNVTGPATLDMTDLTIPVEMWDPDVTYSPGVVGNTMVYSTGFQDVPPYGGYTGDILIDHILIHCDGEGEVTVTLADFVNAGGMGTIDLNWASVAIGPGVTITQVPEPMTLALLGMGGLFLVRRKK